MSTVTSHHVIRWFTTPEELRSIATEMETFWSKCAPGMDKTVITFSGQKEVLEILVDQDRMKSPGWFDAPERRQR